MQYFVEVKTCGYPNGKIFEVECVCFSSIEKAEQFAISRRNFTPYSNTYATIYTFIEGRKAIIR